MEVIAPRLLWHYRIRNWKIETLESEAKFLAKLCRRSMCSIDVGAANGAYTAHSLVYSSKVVAFEPRPEAALHLRNMFRTKLVQVEEVALSDEPGETTLRVPMQGSMLATMEGRNSLEGAPLGSSMTVRKRRLDSYNFTSVGFIKIDVEGHEAAVLRGATETITRERPNVMVEIEERHNPGSIRTVSEWFADLEFSGFFLFENKLVSMSQFRVEEHQIRANLLDNAIRTGTYINNFIFLPTDQSGLI